MDEAYVFRYESFAQLRAYEIYTILIQMSRLSLAPKKIYLPQVPIAFTYIRGYIENMMTKMAKIASRTLRGGTCEILAD